MAASASPWMANHPWWAPYFRNGWS